MGYVNPLEGIWNYKPSGPSVAHFNKWYPYQPKRSGPKKISPWNSQAVPPCQMHNVRLGPGGWGMQESIEESQDPLEQVNGTCFEGGSYSCRQTTCFGQGSIDNVFESFAGFFEGIWPDSAEKSDVPTFSGNLILDANISAALEPITIGCNRYLFVFSQWCPIGQTNWTWCCWIFGGAISLAIFVRGSPHKVGWSKPHARLARVWSSEKWLRNGFK